MRVTVVAGQTDMIPSSDDGGEEDRDRPWTYQLDGTSD